MFILFLGSEDRYALIGLEKLGKDTKYHQKRNNFGGKCNQLQLWVICELIRYLHIFSTEITS